MPPGVDHNKELVYEHCKKLLLNLMLLGANQDCPEVARRLLSYQTNLDATLSLISTDSRDSSASEPPEPRRRLLLDVEQLELCPVV